MPTVPVPPCPAQSRELRPGGADGRPVAMQCPAEERSPPRSSLRTPREPSRSGRRGGGVPLKMWGQGGVASPFCPHLKAPSGATYPAALACFA